MRGALALGGRPAAAAVLAAFAADPVRAGHVPGWWTEGLAFDGVSLLCWLVATGHGRARAAAAGLTVGLLALDRAIFAVVGLPLCVAVAGAVAPPGRRWRAAAAAASLAVAVQLPWWARNVAVAGRFVPLGTQGGSNLPGEYGDGAVFNRGVWDGAAMADVWVPAGTPVAVPPGYSPERFAAVGLGDRRAAALTVAFDYTSTASEVAVSDAGTRAAAAWVAAHPWRAVWLVAAKVVALTHGVQPPLPAAAGLTALAAAAGPPDRRRRLAVLAAVAAAYAAGVGLTHMWTPRFLVPALPPIYLGAAVGAGDVLRIASQRARRVVGGP